MHGPVAAMHVIAAGVALLSGLLIVLRRVAQSYSSAA